MRSILAYKAHVVFTKTVSCIVAPLPEESFRALRIQVKVTYH